MSKQLKDISKWELHWSNNGTFCILMRLTFDDATYEGVEMQFDQFLIDFTVFLAAIRKTFGNWQIDVSSLEVSWKKVSEDARTRAKSLLSEPMPTEGMSVAP